MEAMGRSDDGSSQPRRVEKLCGGPACAAWIVEGDYRYARSGLQNTWNRNSQKNVYNTASI